MSWGDWDHEEVAFEMLWNDRAALQESIEHFDHVEFDAIAEAMHDKDYELIGRLVSNAAERVLRAKASERKDSPRLVRACM